MLAKTIGIVLVGIPLLLKLASAAVVINCDFNGTPYSCNSVNVITTRDDTYITGITGTHQPGKTNADVEAFFVKGNKQVASFPRGLGSYFPNLKKVDFQGTSLRHLFKNDLAGLKNLEFFAIWQGEVDVIPAGFFKDNPKVHEIHCEDNKIKSIGKDVFQLATKPSVLHLRNNVCINMDLENHSLSAIQAHIANNCAYTAQDEAQLCEEQNLKSEGIIKTLEGKVAESAKCSADLQSQKAASTQKDAEIEKLKLENQQLTTENGGLKAKVTDVQKQLTTCSTAKAANEKTLGECKTNLITEKASALNRQTELAAASKELKSCNKNSADLTQQISSQKQTISDLNKTVTHKNNEISILKENKYELTDTLASNAIQLVHETNKTCTLRDNLRDAKAEVAFLSESLAKAKAKV